MKKETLSGPDSVTKERTLLPFAEQDLHVSWLIQKSNFKSSFRILSDWIREAQLAPSSLENDSKIELTKAFWLWAMEIKVNKMIIYFMFSISRLIIDWIESKYSMEIFEIEWLFDSIDGFENLKNKQDWQEQGQKWHLRDRENTATEHIK